VLAALSEWGRGALARLVPGFVRYEADRAAAAEAEAEEAKVLRLMQLNKHHHRPPDAAGRAPSVSASGDLLGPVPVPVRRITLAPTEAVEGNANREPEGAGEQEQEEGQQAAAALSLCFWYFESGSAEWKVSTLPNGEPRVLFKCRLLAAASSCAEGAGSSHPVPETITGAAQAHAGSAMECFGRGDWKGARRRFQKALASLERAEETGPSSQSRLWRCRCMRGVGLCCSAEHDHAEAARWFARASAEDPGEAQVWRDLGTAQSRLGLVEEAAEAADSAVAVEQGLAGTGGPQAGAANDGQANVDMWRTTDPVAAVFRKYLLRHISTRTGILNR
jgi:tetratricopeptide (TPR) repeat protein